MFGLENLGKESVSDAVQKLDPLLHALENRAAGILHGVLDRLNGTKISVEITIPPLPKATSVE